jgi:hypothetical protein
MFLRFLYGNWQPEYPDPPRMMGTLLVKTTMKMQPLVASNMW